MYAALQVNRTNNATVVLKDTFNAVFDVGDTKLLNDKHFVDFTLNSITQERKAWEADAHRTSNQQLYAILAKCYAFYDAMRQAADAGKMYRNQLRAFIAEHNLRFTKTSHGITKVLKCVFYDGTNSIDRRRISTYSLALRSALSQSIKANALVSFIEASGGVQEIRMSSINAKPLVKRAELGRDAVDQAPVLATFRSDSVAQQIDSSDFDQPFVAVIVVRATGEVEVRSLLKSKSAINAALAAHYSENIKQAA